MSAAAAAAAAGEVGLFEMKGGGLSAVKDAAALFLPSTSAAAEATKDTSSGSSELVGTAIGVVLDGIRPLPLEIQALATPRLQDSAGGSAGGDDADSDDNYNGVTTGSDGELDPYADDDDMGEGADDEDRDEGFDSSGFSNGDGDDSDPGLDEFDGSVTRSRGRDRVDVSGVSRELAPLYRHYVGLVDKPRMAMLLELLSKYTPIKVSRKRAVAKHHLNWWQGLVAACCCSSLAYVLALLPKRYPCRPGPATYAPVHSNHQGRILVCIECH
jgi:hypothetical protein